MPEDMPIEHESRISAALDRARRRWLFAATISVGGRWAVLPALAVAFAGMAVGVLLQPGWIWLLMISAFGMLWIAATVSWIRRSHARAGTPGTPDWALALDQAMGMQDALPAYLESKGGFRDALAGRVSAALEPVLTPRARPLAAVFPSHWAPLIVALLLALMPLAFWVPLPAPPQSVAGDKPTDGPETVEDAPDPDIEPLHIIAPEADTLPDATVRQPYTFTFEGEGGTPPYGWQVRAGHLPPGMALEFSSGELSGACNLPDEYVFTVRLVDSAGLESLREVSIKVTPPGDGGGEGDGTGGGADEGPTSGQPQERPGEGGAGDPPPDAQQQPETSQPSPDERPVGDGPGQPQEPPPPVEPPEIDSDARPVAPQADEEGETYSRDRTRWVYNPDGEVRDAQAAPPRGLEHPGEQNVPRTKVTMRERDLIEAIYRKLRQ